ncbi:MAG: lipopolysaccharide assembly protein LapA domain-containing protein [Gallionellaceae bacterium]
MNLKLILTVMLSGLAVWFVAQNSTVVEIAFLFWSFSISTALLIFLGLLAGFLLGWSLHSYLAYRKSVDEYNYLR